MPRPLAVILSFASALGSAVACDHMPTRSDHQTSLALVAESLSVTGDTGDASGPVWYWVANRSSRKCIDVRGGRRAFETDSTLQQWTCLDHQTNQFWLFERPDMDGFRRIRVKHSARCLTTVDRPVNGSRVWQAACGNGDEQKWKVYDREKIAAKAGAFDSTGGPTYFMVEVTDESSANGAKIRLWEHDADRDSQRWMFIRALPRLPDNQYSIAPAYDAQRGFSVIQPREATEIGYVVGRVFIGGGHRFKTVRTERNVYRYIETLGGQCITVAGDRDLAPVTVADCADPAREFDTASRQQFRLEDADEGFGHWYMYPRYSSTRVLDVSQDEDVPRLQRINRGVQVFTLNRQANQRFRFVLDVSAAAAAEP